jgi:hypothetical protein
LADYPFAVTIHCGLLKKEFISYEDFFEAIKNINFAWTALESGCERVIIDGTR